MSDTIKVQATQLGYYEHKRRREGDVFVLVPRKDRYGNTMSAKEQFSKKWMKEVPAETPEKVSTMLKVTPGNLQDHLDKNMPVHPTPEQVIYEASKKKQEPAVKTDQAAEEVI